MLKKITFCVASGAQSAASGNKRRVVSGSKSATAGNKSVTVGNKSATVGNKSATAGSKSDAFVYPPSVQGYLFDYLNPDQRKCVAAVLRVLKKGAQQVLCVSLIDFLEQGLTNLPTDVALQKVFVYLTDPNGEVRHDFGEKAVLRPLGFTPLTYTW